MHAKAENDAFFRLKCRVDSSFGRYGRRCFVGDVVKLQSMRFVFALDWLPIPVKNR